MVISIINNQIGLHQYMWYKPTRQIYHITHVSYYRLRSSIYLHVKYGSYTTYIFHEKNSPVQCLIPIKKKKTLSITSHSTIFIMLILSYSHSNLFLFNLFFYLWILNSALYSLFFHFLVFPLLVSFFQIYFNGELPF